MSDPVRITEAEIREALAVERSGRAAPKDARTVQELVELTGRARTQVTAALRRLKRAGRLVVHQVHRPRLDDQVQLVPAYTLKPEPRKKRR